MVYDNKFTSIQNSASFGLFADNTFNTYSREKLVYIGLECHIKQEVFDPFYQHHHMPDFHVDCLTPNKVRCPFPSVTASEGEQPSANREYIASEGFKIPMTSTFGSDYINRTKENISFSDPIDQKSSDPIDGS